jgi:hypothetical protein
VGDIIYAFVVYCGGALTGPYVYKVVHASISKLYSKLSGK